MSRIGKAPIDLPEKVEVTIGAGEISVKGPLGTLTRALSPVVEVEKQDKTLLFRPAGHSRQGFERRLTLVGVGYRAQAQGDRLNLTLGFSHPVVHPMPKGVKVETPTQTEIVLKGTDRQLVGQVAAEVRAYRRPEPYKGKGVRYAGEQIVLKETKKK
jgi:large subunit ribosomal protein L6